MTSGYCIDLFDFKFKKKSSTFTLDTLTSHGAESKALVVVIIMSGTAPPHAVTTPIRGAFSVVASAVEEGKVTEGVVGVSTSCCHDCCSGEENMKVTICF